ALLQEPRGARHRGAGRQAAVQPVWRDAGEPGQASDGEEGAGPAIHRLAGVARGPGRHCRLQDQRRAAVLSQRRRPQRLELNGLRWNRTRFHLILCRRGKVVGRRGRQWSAGTESSDRPLIRRRFQSMRTFLAIAATFVGAFVIVGFTASILETWADNHRYVAAARYVGDRHAPEQNIAATGFLPAAVDNR